MSNFKSQAKRKRELAKLDKRQAKEKKRALRKAERPGTEVGAPTPTTIMVAQPKPASDRPVLGSTPLQKPMTLAEAVDRWKKTRVAKPKKR
jgi:hypothetical protein